MIGEFVLVVSLLGDYTDNEYVGNFANCIEAQEYYELNCVDYKAMACLLEKYMMLPDNHLSLSPFDFKINAPQSCGFVGVDTTLFTN